MYFLFGTLVDVMTVSYIAVRRVYYRLNACVYYTNT